MSSAAQAEILPAHHLNFSCKALPEKSMGHQTWRPVLFNPFLVFFNGRGRLWGLAFLSLGQGQGGPREHAWHGSGREGHGYG